MRIDHINLDEIEKRFNLASKGPWETHHDNEFVSYPTKDSQYKWVVGAMDTSGINEGLTDENFRGDNIKNNCIFIANARQDIPLLFEEVKRLRELLGIKFEPKQEYIQTSLV